VRVLLNALQAGNLSGTGRYATQLARWLPQVEGDAEVFLVWPQGLPRPLTSSPQRGSILEHRPGAINRLVYDQLGIHRTARELKADLIHYPANIGSVLSASPNVVTIHDLSFFHDPAWFPRNRAHYYRTAVARSARNARRVIADSHATADDVRTMLRIPEDRIDVVPLGVEEHFSPADAHAQEAARTKYKLPATFFLYVGTLEPRKNLIRLVQAFEQIANDCDLDLVLAGRDGWKTRALHKTIAASPVKSRIHLPGFIAYEDLPALLSAAHTFVWPSLCEGFGLPPLEAMACGTPVLASDVSSVPEVVGDAGLLVNPYDTDTIAEAMARLASDEALRNHLRTQGPERAATFTWRATAEQTLASYVTAAS
jgi:glycosyltransferase involved in cell wall biosynthesis